MNIRNIQGQLKNRYPVVPNNMYNRGSTTSVSSNSAPRMSSNLTKARQQFPYQNGRNWTSTHKVVPPPLPQIPASSLSVPVPPSSLAMPPKFLLSIKRHQGCVQLSWKTDLPTSSYAEIKAYELFACQPTVSSSHKSSGWKKID